MMFATHIKYLGRETMVAFRGNSVTYRITGMREGRSNIGIGWQGLSSMLNGFLY